MEKLRPEQLREKANMLPLLPGVYIMPVSYTHLTLPTIPDV